MDVYQYYIAVRWVDSVKALDVNNPSFKPSSLIGPRIPLRWRWLTMS